MTGEVYADALAASEARVAQTGALAVHAYDQPETLFGQGSVGLELEADRPEIDTLLVAVGGGGLIGGIAAWYEGRVRVVAVEPEAAPTLHDALKAGHPVDAPAGGVAADLLAPRQVGGLMFPIAQKHVESASWSATTRSATPRPVMGRLRVAAEPGGAAALAALLSGRYRPARRAGRGAALRRQYEGGELRQLAVQTSSLRAQRSNPKSFRGGSLDCFAEPSSGRASRGPGGSLTAGRLGFRSAPSGLRNLSDSRRQQPDVFASARLNSTLPNRLSQVHPTDLGEGKSVGGGSGCRGIRSDLAERRRACRRPAAESPAESPLISIRSGPRPIFLPGA